ncbi:hypothetical protein RvY_06233 [Ramazzottius varieornatus]|uniref:DDE-1 domain-containing protein n=1 Tax=Ramazzottius varieornatus TaxID=947166 RepID=A0A1D1V3C3_RAMVA|nr:hypothetical protein RvY_06233 [Ramazzottius varieornatus]
MEVSDDKFIKLFEETAERKRAFKEAESKRVYDLEAKKLELCEKELEIERPAGPPAMKRKRQERFPDMDKKIIIPGGMTGKWQPLDVRVNKCSEDYFKTSYRSWRKNNIGFTKSENLRKSGKKDFVQFISESWDKVSEDTVRKSFYVSEVLRREESLPNQSNFSVGEVVEELDSD